MAKSPDPNSTGPNSPEKPNSSPGSASAAPPPDRRTAAGGSAAGKSGANEPRRNFLTSTLAVAVWLVAGLIPLGAGLLAFFDPLRRKPRVPLLYQKHANGDDYYIQVATLEAVPDDGEPRRFPVIAHQSDAWNFSPSQPVGAVFLRREPGERTVHVFHATCPHAGCAVTFVSDRNVYLCPCHNSAFDLEGERISVPGVVNPSPRGLDSLEIDDQRLAATGEIWVRFLNFYAGRPDKKPMI